jgi:hypothetical protein
MGAVLTLVPVVRAEIALYAPARAAALLCPAEGRWPAHERADRVHVGLATAILAGQGAPGPRWQGYRETLAHVALGIAAAARGPLPADLAPLVRLGLPGVLAVVPWEGPGRLNAECHLLATRAGLVPRLARRPAAAGPGAEVAALALLIALAADREDDRLALALGVEGVLAWYRASDRRTAPRNALAYALHHARRRLEDVGRALPPGLSG